MIVIIDTQGGLTFTLRSQVAACTSHQVMIMPHEEASLLKLQNLDPKALILSSHPGKGSHALASIIQHFSSQIPILGISFGMWALVEVFGGTILPAEKPVFGKACLAYHHHSPHYLDIPSPFMAGCYYAYMVEEASLPSDFQVEARTAEGVVMGISHQTLPCYGVQFNPESMLTPEGRLLVENFIKHV